MVAPVELVRELLHYRDMKMVSGRDWAFITAMIAGGSIAFPVLAPFALGSMVVLGISKVREVLMRRVIAGVELPVVRPAPGAKTVVGTPRKFRGTLPSLVDNAPVLIEHAVVRDREGGVLIRRTSGTTFLLERHDDVPVLVTGAARLVATGLLGKKPLRAHVLRGDDRLARMGVPADLAINGELSVSSLGEAELIVSVTGLLEEEAIADFAFHRDGGRVPVMRGQPGAPVIIEDRRLVAAALGG
jgi:hypothetical protein